MVRENLDLGSYRARGARRAQIASAYSRSSRACGAATQTAGTLSGGEQQMLAIGRGLMAEPKLLILDEPSLGLSPLLVEELFALIARSTPKGSPSCWSSRTWCRASSRAAAPISWKTAHSCCRDARRHRADPNLKRAYLGNVTMTDAETPARPPYARSRS